MVISVGREVAQGILTYRDIAGRVIQRRGHMTQGILHGRTPARGVVGVAGGVVVAINVGQHAASIVVDHRGAVAGRVPGLRQAIVRVVTVGGAAAVGVAA